MFEVDYLSEEHLQWLEPPSEQRSQFGEAVYVHRVVELLLVANMTGEDLCKVVAILQKGVIILTMPKVAKINDDVINLVHRVISNSNRNPLF